VAEVNIYCVPQSSLDPVVESLQRCNLYHAKANQWYSALCYNEQALYSICINMLINY